MTKLVFILLISYSCAKKQTYEKGDLFFQHNFHHDNKIYQKSNNKNQLRRIYFEFITDKQDWNLLGSEITEGFTPVNWTSLPAGFHSNYLAII